MKIKSKNSIGIFPILFFLGIFLSSCDRHHIHPKEKDCGCKTKTTATVRNNICGVGVWGGIVLELENGDIVQPWAADSTHFAKMQLKDGQKIKISFSEMQKDNRYDNTIVCMALGPYTDKIKATIKIHCIAPLDKPSNEDLILTTTAEVVDWDCASVGVWNGIQFKTDKGEYLQPWELILKIDPKVIELKAKQQVTITYSLMKADDRYKDKQVCPTFAALPAATTVRIHNITILKN